MEGGHAGALHRAHGALHVGRAAKAGVGIGHHRQTAGVDDLLDAVHHFAEAEQTDVGIAGGAGDGAAAGVDRVEARGFHQAGGQAVVGAGGGDDAARQQFAQAGAGFHDESLEDERWLIFAGSN